MCSSITSFILINTGECGSDVKKHLPDVTQLGGKSLNTETHPIIYLNLLSLSIFVSISFTHINTLEQRLSLSLHWGSDLSLRITHAKVNLCFTLTACLGLWGCARTAGVASQSLHLNREEGRLRVFGETEGNREDWWLKMRQNLMDINMCSTIFWIFSCVSFTVIMSEVALNWISFIFRCCAG